MKNFYKKVKSGLTLVELMIVIAIIGILIVAFSQFNMNANIYQEKVTRLAENVYDILRDTKNDMILGRTSGNFDLVDFRIVEITKSTIKVCLSNNKDDPFDCTKIEKEFSPKFDWDAKYQIKEIKTYNQRVKDNKYEINDSGWTNVDDLKIKFTNDVDGKAKAGNSEDIKSYLIVLEYNGFKRYVFGDVLTGNAFLHTKVEKLTNP